MAGQVGSLLATGFEGMRYESEFLSVYSVWRALAENHGWGDFIHTKQYYPAFASYLHVMIVPAVKEFMPKEWSHHNPRELQQLDSLPPFTLPNSQHHLQSIPTPSYKPQSTQFSHRKSKPYYIHTEGHLLTPLSQSAKSQPPHPPTPTSSTNHHRSLPRYTHPVLSSL